MGGGREGREMLVDVSLFDHGLLTDRPGERQMGIIARGPDDKRPILMSLFSHCGASLSSPKSG